MPLVIIEADEGRTVDQKRGFVKDITDAVCKNFTVGKLYSTPQFPKKALIFPCLLSLSLGIREFI